LEDVLKVPNSLSSERWIVVASAPCPINVTSFPAPTVLV
jgi:hypothetical protein